MAATAAEGRETHPGSIPIPDDDSSYANISSCSKKKSVSISSQIDFDRTELLRSPTYESPAGFEDYDFEVLIRWYKRIWSFVLGLAGILDILAYMEPTLRGSYNERCTCTAGLDFGESISDLLLEQLDDDREAFTSVPWYWEWYCSTWITFLDRLREYNIVIAFAFSWLWFQNSQMKAREKYYYKFTVQEDRMELFSSTRKSDSNSKGLTKRNKKKFNARNHYYRQILFRTLLLPAGFYVILFHLIRGLMRGEWLYRELLIPHTNETVFLTVQDPNEYMTIEISEAHAKMSTIFAIFIYLKYHFLLATTAARVVLKTSYIPRLRRMLVVNAARRPRNFLRQLKKVLKYVRWIRYIIPLVVKLNKLRANTVATLRKRRQYRKAKKLKSIQKALRLQKKSQAEKEEDATILIQRAWRSYQKYKHQRLSCQRVAVHFIKNKRLSAAMKIQLAFRRAELQARIKLSHKKRELFHLERLKRQASQEMNDEERKRLYELQDEFMAEAKKTINKRLLMRPNTMKAVLWNSIIVFCVLVEISHTALRPWLEIPKAKRTEDRKHKSMRLFLAESLIPTPVAEMPACKNIFKKQSAFKRLFYRRHHVEQPARHEVVSAFIEEITDPDYGLEGMYNETNPMSTPHSNIPWRCSEPISTWRDGYRDLVALALSPNPVSEWPACMEKETSWIGKIVSPFRKKRADPLPWYCSKPYSIIHNGYRSTWNFIIDQIYVVISVMSFLDVFVKFFAGEIDPVTRELKPKPFIRRWLFPGLLLQLLVNPAIGSFSVLVFRISQFVMVIGPVRVLRWFIAVGVPMVYALRNIAFKALQEVESDMQITQHYW